MPKPRFSVVIPTRERAKYLDYAIRSCLAQSFGDLEIIVADNCSSASTRETVERHPDQRIRYLRSDQSLAMSANWERGLQAATGEYVTVLGDDDALLLHALADADSLLRSTHSEALRWTCAHYRWPDVAPELAPNLFLIPTSSEACGRAPRRSFATSPMGSGTTMSSRLSTTPSFTATLFRPSGHGQGKYWRV